jgi:predicted protein tyrosine phosphatase
MIHVCSLARMHELVETIGARHVVSLLASEDHVLRPYGVPEQNHLWLRMHDIAAPLGGFVPPESEHVEQLIDFVQRWDRAAPMVVHCFAGISRSTAAAFVSVCALNPARDEFGIAQALRAASPTAFPNPRIVALGDEVLGRRGRMTAAVEAIGRGWVAIEGEPFRLDIE